MHSSSYKTQVSWLKNLCPHMHTHMPSTVGKFPQVDIWGASTDSCFLRLACTQSLSARSCGSTVENRPWSHPKNTWDFFGNSSYILYTAYVCMIVYMYIVFKHWETLGCSLTQDACGKSWFKRFCEKDWIRLSWRGEHRKYLYDHVCLIPYVWSCTYDHVWLCVIMHDSVRMTPY